MASEGLSIRHEMPDEPGAEDDYRSFCEALSSTARGRAFLEEFSRRNRQADTETVLNALNRLEATALSHAATSPEADRIRQDLRALLDTLRRARPQTENSPTAIKAATLAALIDFAQARIEALVLMPGEVGEGEPLAAVPSPDQPELPIPHPTATSAPVMALVPAPSATTATQAIGLSARRKMATVVPVVEFDYRTHQTGRPAPVRSGPEEDWSALAPPVIALPAYPAPLPSSPAITEPTAAPSPAPEAMPQAADAGIQAGAIVEPYELWLDPPTVAAAEPATSANTAIELSSTTVDLALAEIVTPWPQADWDVARNDAALETPPVIEASIDATTTETTVAETVVSQADVTQTDVVEMGIVETGIAEIDVAQTTVAQTTVAQITFDAGATEAPMTAQAVEHDVVTAGSAMTTIEALMQQMEKTAAPAPAVRGHAEGVDPLAPIMALSEEERIALFT